MKKVIRLTESDLVRLVKRVMNEQMSQNKIDPKPFYKCGSDEVPIIHSGQLVEKFIKLANAFLRMKGKDVPETYMNTLSAINLSELNTVLKFYCESNNKGLYNSLNENSKKEYSVIIDEKIRNYSK